MTAREIPQRDRPDGPDGPIEVTVEPPPDPRWHRFAMRLALGASVTEASHRAGVSRTTGYEWRELEGVQRLVERYGGEAQNRARRELAGLVRQAVRTLREVLKDGSPKGSPTRLEAAKLVLNWNRIDVVPVAQTTRRILTRVPRPDDLPQGEGDSLPEPLTAGAALPVVPTPDGLPPDFPRHPDGSVDLGQPGVAYLPPGTPDLGRLADPGYWAGDDPGRRTMRRFGDGQGRRDPRSPDR